MLLKFLSRSFSTKTVPQIDISNFLNTKNEKVFDRKACNDIIEAFHVYGCVAIKDPRVGFPQSEHYLDMMEEYFAKRGNHFYKTGQLIDCYPETGYETGITPEKTEKARKHEKLIATYTKENKPWTPLEPESDPKWRYMFPMKKKEKQSNLKSLDPEHTNPSDFPDFSKTMESWGTNLMNCVSTVSEMSAIGLDLPIDFFTKKTENGHNILAPTGSDLNRYKKGTIFAGFHYDFNFLTIHGKSRFPGLYIWLNTGERIAASIPDGYLLLQSGRQFEISTGGYILKGMHEVVYDDRTEKKVEEYKKKGKKDIWRISSTMFIHFDSDCIIEPVGKFRTPEALKAYPKISSYDLKEEELTEINLLKRN